MKYYSYSVKDKLIAYFGEENTIAAMRHIKRNEDRHAKDWIPLAWQYADQESLGYFLSYSQDFLMDTILADDYIVYLTAFGDKNRVFILFMFTQQQAPFRLDTEYAREITEYWGEKYGCETVIIGSCVGVSAGLRFSSSSQPAYQRRLYTVSTLNGKAILTELLKPCWPFFIKKFVSVAKTNNLQEYECLFEPGVRITRGENNKEEVLNTGIIAIKDFIEKYGPAKHIYKREKNADYYVQGITVGNYWIDFYVNGHNLISEINIKILETNEDMILSETAQEDFCSLVSKVPAIQSVRTLNVAQIHGYGIQLCYADGTVRNYYLKSFETRNIPEQCVIDGYSFTKEILQTVRTDKDNSVQFDNGYVIKAHILYYRSYRQVEIKQKDAVLYENEKCRIRLLYQSPLVQFHGWRVFRVYWGNPDEYFGPAYALLDKKGNRTSDVSYYHKDSGDDKVQATVVCVEPSVKYGILKDDGTWVAPPIYTDIVDEITEGVIKATRPSDGKCCILTPNGKEVVFGYPIETEWFENGRCQFTTGRWEGEEPDKGGYWEYEDMDPGNWGFIDTEGQIVIKPQYVYVTGFHEGKENNCIVAKMVSGKLKWGVINREGIEVVPCKYPFVFSPRNDVIIYQEKKDGPFGLMEFDGTVIIEPQFGYIEKYNRDKRLVVAGKNEYSLGIYSMDLHMFIIPEKYDCVFFETEMITCEPSGSDEEVYYDYSGKEIMNPVKQEIDFNGTGAFTKRGLHLIGEEKQQGLVDEKGRVILKPEYTFITIQGDFIKATTNNDTNWSVRDYLFDMDGNPVLKGIYRNLLFDDNKEYISVETPSGEQFLRIERKA